MRELDTPRDMDWERRIKIHESIPWREWNSEGYNIRVSLKSARSVIGNYGCKFLLKPKLLRVMSGDAGIPGTCFQQVNLRFLVNVSDITLNISHTLPPSMSLLWNLQTIILKDSLFTPFQIWEMPQLRHFRSPCILLSEPPPSDKQDCIVLRNLQTLGRVKKFRFSEEACKRMPNIRKLHLSVDYNASWEGRALSYYCHYNLACLSKLEVLRYQFDYRLLRDDVLQNLVRFPSSLKKLTLRGCKFHWHDLTMIGSLPHLESLKLASQSVQGHKWNPVDGEFLRLKYLRIFECIGLEDWNAESSHFPVLEELILERLWHLNEIPLGIGEIPTLRDIYMHRCSVSAAISAMEIVKEQEDFGNQELQVRVKFGHVEHQEEFREKMEEEGFASPSFQMFMVEKNDWPL